MDQADAILDSWLAEQNARINQLSAGSLGFSASKLRPDWLASFLQSLLDNRDAARLVQELLPKCRVPALAVFVVLGVSTQLKSRLIADVNERGGSSNPDCGPPPAGGGDRAKRISRLTTSYL